MRCNIKVSGERCHDEPAYWVWFDNCEVCMVGLGWIGCFGHRCCVLHAAQIRTDAYRFADFRGKQLPGGDVTAIRLTGVTR